MPEDPKDPILTVAEAALELRISKSQVHKLIRGHVEDCMPLPCIRVGRRQVIPRSGLERWKRLSISDSGILAPEEGSEKNTVTHSKGVN